MKLFALLILATLILVCRPSKQTKEETWNIDNDEATTTVGAVSFTFPSDGFAFSHRDSLVTQCMESIRHDCTMIHLPEFKDSILIRFVRSRQEMKSLIGREAAGFAMPGSKTLYLVAGGKVSPPIKHELMHMVSMTTWGHPAPSSTWMNEGLAAFAENDCNGYTDEQIYRFLLEKNLLVPVDSLTADFYRQPEMIAYHQSAYIVQYLLEHYGVEKFITVWQKGSAEFQKVYGIPFSQVEVSINTAVKKHLRHSPAIHWEVFKKGCM